MTPGTWTSTGRTAPGSTSRKSWTRPPTSNPPIRPAVRATALGSSSMSRAARRWADRADLRDVQYRTDANLSARQNIYAFQRPRIDLPAAVLDLAGLRGAETVADVGCGNGAYLAELAARGHGGAVLGADMSAGML